MYFKITESGTASSDSDYDLAIKGFRIDTTFSKIGLTNQTKFIYRYQLIRKMNKIIILLCICLIFLFKQQFRI